jgi:hypothetical protein
MEDKPGISNYVKGHFNAVRKELYEISRLCELYDIRLDSEREQVEETISRQERYILRRLKERKL